MKFLVPPPTPVLTGNVITVSDGTPAISFHAISGFQYRLMYVDALTDLVWQAVIYSPNYPLPDGWSTNTGGGLMRIIDEDAASKSQRFYRLSVTNP